MLTMGKRFAAGKKVWAWPLMWLALIGLLLFCGKFIPARRPVFEGKPLEYWLNQLPGTRQFRESRFTNVSLTYNLTYYGKVYGPTNPVSKLEQIDEKAVQAIRTIGTNGLPKLLATLRKQDPSLQKKAARLAARWGWGRYLPDMSDPGRWQAITAFRLLGSAANSAQPQLLVLSTNHDPSVSSAAAMVLNFLEDANYNKAMKKPDPFDRK